MNKKIFFLIIFCLFSIKLFADSPITSTQFHKAYMDIHEVKKAKKEGVMSLLFFSVLTSESRSIDEKAALINALGWNFNGKNNSEIFLDMLIEKYKVKEMKSFFGKLSGGEIFCLGYLRVMDRYNQPKEAIPLLQLARKKIPASFTVAIVLALTEAQEAMNTSWCKVWRLAEKVKNDKKLKQDMRKKAVDIIMKYMILYKDDCK